MSSARVLLLGTRRVVGVSSLAKGIVVYCRELGYTISASSTSSSFAETTHFRRITSRLSHTIHPIVLEQEAMYASYICNVQGADIHVFEGGCIDWISHSIEFYDRINVPVVLVIDARVDLADDGVRLAHALEVLNRYPQIGLIANYVESVEQEEQVRKFCKSHDYISLVGMVPLFDEGQFAGRSSLSVNRNSSLLTRNQLVRLKSLVEKHLDSNAILTLAKSAKKISHASQLAKVPQSVCRIAVADDSAFHLSIQDNWDLLRRGGAELVSFSPLIDKVLPKNIHGIYIAGSYFHLYAEEILQNQSICRSIVEAVSRGVPTYIEGDSVAMFCREIDPGFGSSMEGLGIFPANAFFSNDSGSWSENISPNPDTFFIHTAAQESLIGEKGFKVNSIHSALQEKEFWRYTFISKTQSLFEEERISHPLTSSEIPESMSSAMTRGVTLADSAVAMSCNLHWGSCPSIATSIVSACVKYRNQHSYAE